MSQKNPNEQKQGFLVGGDKPKSGDLKPSNINPPTPRKLQNPNQKNP
ncbi:MAG: hypothetical protein HC903_29845 [Methylacidiphilales bacterium]|nr:hypothetical protein [Candidatus Methylacidiphilales bacterium]